MNKQSNQSVQSVMFRFALGFVILAYVLALVLATWDRPELAVPAQAALALGMIVFAIDVCCKKRIVLTWYDGAVVAVAAFFYVRAICSPVVIYGQADAGLILSAVSMWIVLRNGIKLGGAYRWLLLMLVIVLVQLAACFYQETVDASWGVLRVRGGRTGSYVSGLFGHYNYLANLFAMLACAGLGFVFYGKNSWLLKILALMVVASAVGGVLWTQSRGGVVALGAGLLVFSLIYIFTFTCGRGVGLKKVVAVMLIVVTLLAGLVFSATRLASVRGYLSDGFFKSNGRVENVIMAVDQISEGSVVGTGSRSFEWRSNDYWLEDLWNKTPLPNYVHNEYLQALTDYGLFGGLSLMVLLVMALWLAARRMLAHLNDVDALAWNVAGICACAAFLTQCLVSFPAHVLVNLLTLVMMMTFVLYRKETKAHSLGGGGVVAVTFGIVLIVTAQASLVYKQLPTLMDRFESVKKQKASVSWQPEERLAKVTQLAQWNPTYKNLKEKAALHWQMSLSSKDAEFAADQMTLAAESYMAAVEHYPWEPSLQVSAGRALDRCLRFEEAEPYFLKAFHSGKRSEYWVQSRVELAKHYIYYGNYVWRKRDPDAALEKFLMAEELLLNRREAEAPALLKQVQDYIRFFEKTGVGSGNSE